jgi:hypothetical protein
VGSRGDGVELETQIGDKEFGWELAAVSREDINPRGTVMPCLFNLSFIMIFSLGTTSSETAMALNPHYIPFI